jgi:hypothetical protein
MALDLNPKNKGLFTAAAKRKGKSVQGYAADVIKKYKGKKGMTDRERTLLKRAVFAKNAKKFKR